MPLSHQERERIVDSRQRIRSVAESLNHVDPRNVPDFEEIQDCLEDADKSLSGALQRKEENR